MGTFITVAVVGLVLFLALRSAVRTKKSGGCGCGCEHCANHSFCHPDAADADKTV